MKRIIISTLMFLLLISVVNASACITIAGSYTEELTYNEPNYFSFRLYNTTVADYSCDTAIYRVELSIDGENIDEIFNYEISENNFELKNGDNQRVMITLTPKVQEGVYKVKVTGIRVPNDAGMTTLVYTTTGIINVKIGSAEPEVAEVPFWFTHKNCPDGTVILNEEECPVIVEEIEEEDQTPTGLFMITEGQLLIYGGFVGFIVVLGFLAFLFYQNRMAKNKVKQGAYAEDWYD